MCGCQFLAVPTDEVWRSAAVSVLSRLKTAANLSKTIASAWQGPCDCGNRARVERPLEVLLESPSESPLGSKASDDENSPDPLQQSALPFDEPAPAVAADAAARCESCGGPAEAGDLCAVCERAFHGLLDAPRDNEKPEVSDHAAELDALFKALETTPSEAPATFEAPAPPALSEVLAPPVADVETGPPPATVTPAVATESATSASPAPPMPAAPAVPAAPALSVEAVAPEKQSAPATVAVRALRVGQFRSLATAAAIVIIVSAIGVPLTKLWLGRQQQIIRVAEPASRAESPAVSAAPRRAAASDAPTTSLPRKIETPAAVHGPAPVVAATLPGTRKPSPRVQPRTARPTQVAASQPAVAIPGVVNDAPVEAALPEPVVPPAPVAPEAPAAPLGPFFEVRTVDQPPQITSRVEPQVPASLQGHALNEIVVVRILVSQAGQPALVSLLRRSRSGPELDGAVVAAVKQWSFTPAAKRGEAVSCFLNVGVAIGRTE